MRSKSLVVLLVVAVVLVGLAVRGKRHSDVAPPPVLGQAILPDLAVNDIERITVASQGSTATVARVESGWAVAETYNYPANFDHVRNALIKLSELKIGDAVRTDEATRKGLGIASPDAGQPDATLVRLEGGGKSKDLWLGKNHMRRSPGESPYGGEYPDGRYVSPDSGANVYVVKDMLTEFAAQPLSWLNTELMNVDAAALTRILVTGTNGLEVALTASPDGASMNVDGITAQEEADATKVASLRNALAYLNLQDLADPKLDDKALGFDSPAAFTAETRDGRTYHVAVGGLTQDGGRYVRCRVEFKEPPAPAADTNTSAVATNAPALPDYSGVRRDVAALNQKLSAWTYVVPAYKAQSMVPARADLVKPKPAPEAPAAPAVPPAPPAPETTPAPEVTAPAAATPASAMEVSAPETVTNNAAPVEHRDEHAN